MLNTKNLKTVMMTGAALLTLGMAAQAMAADATVTTTTSADGTVKATTVKHHSTVHAKVKTEPKILNATPGDVKTSNDDSGMSGDVQAHDKVMESTEEK